MRTGAGVNLRRSAYARVAATNQLNNTTLALRNNTASSELLLVWGFGFNLNIGSADVFLLSQQRISTAFVGTATTFPIVPTDAPPPGQLGYFNSTTVFTPSWVWYNANTASFWPITFPFTVLPPGWNLCIQDSTTATGPIDLAMWWEAITPEEFEYQYGDTGLAVKRPAGAV